MEDLHATIKNLQLTAQALLKKYNNLKKENEFLAKENDAIKKLLSEKEQIINVSQERTATNNITASYNTEEKELLRAKIDIYLKDIEKCLGLLNA